MSLKAIKEITKREDAFGFPEGVTVGANVFIVRRIDTTRRLFAVQDIKSGVWHYPEDGTDLRQLVDKLSPIMENEVILREQAKKR